MRGYRHMSCIRDIAMAPSGEMKIKWVERNMPVLRGIGEEFTRKFVLIFESALA